MTGAKPDTAASTCVLPLTRAVKVDCDSANVVLAF
jgi:hypothetical protein